MAYANVEIIRRFLDLALRCRDLDAAMQLALPDAEMDWSNSRAPYRGVYRGFDEAIGAWRTWLEAWEEWSTEITEAIDVDPETVVIVTQVHARGRGSGITVEAEGAGVWQSATGRSPTRSSTSRRTKRSPRSARVDPPDGRPVKRGACKQA